MSIPEGLLARRLQHMSRLHLDMSPELIRGNLLALKGLRTELSLPDVGREYLSLYEDPDVRAEVEGRLIDIPADNSDPDILEVTLDYVADLQQIEDVYLRRSVVADHLLARFAKELLQTTGLLLEDLQPPEAPPEAPRPPARSRYEALLDDDGLECDDDEVEEVVESPVVKTKEEPVHAEPAGNAGWSVIAFRVKR